MKLINNSISVIKDFFGKHSTQNTWDEDLVWSDNPGCFECHLKRKFNNPIYSLSERTISQSQINKARKKDTKEMRKFNELCIKFSHFLSSPNGFIDHFDAQEKSQKIIEASYKTGGTALNLIPGFMEFHDGIMKEWKDSVLDHPDRLEGYSAFEAVTRTIFDTFLNPFIMQTIRSDSPIKKDLAEAVLSEDMETIKKFTMWSIRNNREESFKTDLTHKVNAMISRGENIPMLDDKLKLLGIELKTSDFKEEEFIKKIHKSVKYLPETTHTSELIKCIISGDMAKVFKLHEALMDAVIRFRKSSAASDLVAAIEADELREKIMEDVQLFYEKKGHKDIVELIQQGRTRVSRYMKFQPIRDKIMKLVGIALFVSALIYMWK